MTNLRFKDYVFRHNPEKLIVTCQKKVARFCCYGFGETIQELGRGVIRIEGEGELFGADAMKQFIRLKQLMQQSGSGILSGAGLEPMQAVFADLKMTGKGGKEEIGYWFCFIEQREQQRWN